jgi:hypothetical protein
MRGLLESDGVESPVCLSRLAHDIGIRGPQVCLSEVFQHLGSTLPSVDDWLRQTPNVGNAIIWQDGAGVHPWASWPRHWQAELTDAFERAWVRLPIPVAAVPANLVQLADNQEATTVLSTVDAWAYFKASVAQSLALELGGGWARRGVRQPWWSTLNFTADQLAQLLDSREMFHWNVDPAGYLIDETYHGRVVPGPPWYSFDFLVRNNLIVGTRLELIGRVIEWCRTNLYHHTGGGDAKNMEGQFQYRGWPPVVRMIDGTIDRTIYTSEPLSGVQHPAAGCWATTGFLRAVLRSVNIPVKLVKPADHAQPWFMADGRYLSHGDDPYGGFFAWTPEAPGEALLIDQALWDAWFGAGLTHDERCKNVGRQPAEIALGYLPNFLLRSHCNDLANGSAKAGDANDRTSPLFRPYYTPDELTAKGFWARMDAKIAALGGCAKVPKTN